MFLSQYYCGAVSIPHVVRVPVPGVHWQVRCPDAQNSAIRPDRTEAGSVHSPRRRFVPLSRHRSWTAYVNRVWQQRVSCLGFLGCAALRTAWAIFRDYVLFVCALLSGSCLVLGRNVMPNSH